MTTERVMLLIDADNVSLDVMEQAVRLVLQQHGALHVRRAYCTAESALKHQAMFKHLGIKPMVNLAAGKNSTDIAMAVDAIDLVLAERPDVVVIASSDSDFAPLVQRLREKGCVVRGIGQSGKTGDETKDVYDDYTVLEHRPAAAARRLREVGDGASGRGERSPARRGARKTTAAGRGPAGKEGASQARKRAAERDGGGRTAPPNPPRSEAAPPARPTAAQTVAERADAPRPAPQRLDPKGADPDRTRDDLDPRVDDLDTDDRAADAAADAKADAAAAAAADAAMTTAAGDDAPVAPARKTASRKTAARKTPARKNTTKAPAKTAATKTPAAKRAPTARRAKAGPAATDDGVDPLPAVLPDEVRAPATAPVPTAAVAAAAAAAAAAAVVAAVAAPAPAGGAGASPHGDPGDRGRSSGQADGRDRVPASDRGTEPGGGRGDGRSGGQGGGGLRPTTLQALLECLPELERGQGLALNVAVQRLRESRLLGRNTSSLRLFSQWADRFELLPADKPSQVRLRAA